MGFGFWDLIVFIIVFLASITVATALFEQTVKRETKWKFYPLIVVAGTLIGYLIYRVVLPGFFLWYFMVTAPFLLSVKRWRTGSEYKRAYFWLSIFFYLGPTFITYLYFYSYDFRG